MISLVDLHGIAQRTGGPGNDGDLLYRGGIRLPGGHKRVADLVISHDMLFFVGQDGILFLIAGNYGLDALLKVGLRGRVSSVADGPQSGLVDDVCQLGTGRTGCHARDHGVINISGSFDFLCVNLQDRLTAFEIRQFNRNTAVKTSRTGERRVEGFRTVGRSQDNHPVVALEAVHLRQQLVERLFALIVPAEMRAAASLLPDRVDFIYKHDTGRFLLGLPEQIADFGGTHADKHLDEFRAGY